MKKATIIGPYPPPHGGISVYIQRHRKQLERQGYEVNIIDDRANVKYGLLKLLFSFQKEEVWCNSHSMIICAIATLIGIFNRRKRIILKFHNSRFKLSFLQANLFSFFAHRIIAVSDEVKARLIGFGIVTFIEIEPDFIAPRLSANVSEKDLPDFISSFINKKGFVITTSVGNLGVKGYKDLYGIMQCLRMMENLIIYDEQFGHDNWKRKYLGLIVCISQMNDYPYFDFLQKRLLEMGLWGAVLWVFDINCAWRIWKRSNLFIRATSTDGDSSAIREALHFGVPVIASDVVKRPEGVITFNCNDTKDLTKKVKAVMEGVNA